MYSGRGVARSKHVTSEKKREGRPSIKGPVRVLREEKKKTEGASIERARIVLASVALLACLRALSHQPFILLLPPAKAFNRISIPSSDSLLLDRLLRRSFSSRGPNDSFLAALRAARYAHARLRPPSFLPSFVLFRRDLPPSPWSLTCIPTLT